MSDATGGDGVIGDLGTRRRAPREQPTDRRRNDWRDFRHAYPGFILTLAIAFFGMLLIDGWLLYRRVAYDSDIRALRTHMSAAEKQRTDLIVETTQSKLRIELELAKRQALMQKGFHLNVSVDSARMYLASGGATLREIPVQFGPQRMVTPGGDSLPSTVPLGERTVAEVSDDAIVLDGGSRVVVSPTSIADDPSPVPAGALRIGRADMDAIRPNLSAGMKVYFY